VGKGRLIMHGKDVVAAMVALLNVSQEGECCSSRDNKCWQPIKAFVLIVANFPRCPPCQVQIDTDKTLFGFSSPSVQK